ncbi:protein of unknown function (plasmid) [Aminobacter niigataensis]|nr:protein of unknown function [Aminobacter niigataensis]
MNFQWLCSTIQAHFIASNFAASATPRDERAKRFSQKGALTSYCVTRRIASQKAGEIYGTASELVAWQSTI